MKASSKIVPIMVLAILAFAPMALSAQSDAAGTWWGETVDIPIEAGSTFNYSAVSVPDGQEIKKLSVEGSLASSFTVTGNDLSGSIPSGTASGEYTLVLKAETSKSTHWINFVFHVTEASEAYGHSANGPQIEKVDIKPVGNNTKVAYITLGMKNVDTVKFDYADGICTDDISVSSEIVSTTHKFSKDGLYALSITATNDYGSINKVVVYDAGNMNSAEQPSGEVAGEESNGFMELVPYILALVGAVCIVVWSFIKEPIAIIAGIIAVVASLLMFGGVF